MSSAEIAAAIARFEAAVEDGKYKEIKTVDLRKVKKAK